MIEQNETDISAFFVYGLREALLTRHCTLGEIGSIPPGAYSSDPAESTDMFVQRSIEISETMETGWCLHTSFGTFDRSTKTKIVSVGYVICSALRPRKVVGVGFDTIEPHLDAGSQRCIDEISLSVTNNAPINRGTRHEKDTARSLIETVRIGFTTGYCLYAYPVKPFFKNGN